MAFRIQDPETKLFWKLDGKNIILAETGDDFTEDENGKIVGVATLSSRVYSLPRETTWKFTEDGAITCDGYRFIVADARQMRPLRSLQKQVWTKVGGVPAPEVPEVEAAPEVPEPAPEVPETEPESEEDVPVARSAALIEEALNAQAAEPEEEEEEA
jgi:hypothetical protein